MLKRHRLTLVLTVGALLLAAPIARAQNYPTKPVRLVTSDAGGASDFSARLIAQALSGTLKQPVIVDNRAGIVPIETVARAQPDGYTLLYFGSGIFLLPLMQSNLPYATSQFTPVTWATMAPQILAVNPSLQVKSAKELIALARAKPGGLNYGSGASGTIQHLASEMLKWMAKVDIVQVSYKGPGAVTTDLLGGHIQVMFGGAAGVLPHVKSGKLIALGITSAEPSPLLPGIPPLAEAAGLPGFDATSISGVYAPAKTPPALINRLHAEIARVLTTPESRDKHAAAGSEVVAGSPEAFAAQMKAQVTTLGKVIKEVGIRIN